MNGRANENRIEVIDEEIRWNLIGVLRRNIVSPFRECLSDASSDCCRLPLSGSIADEERTHVKSPLRVHARIR
ncbi:hypothetical protein SAMN05444422_109190 [Halobiforma haloterrestris]|uniref:Uncharacterized protein n=1 Tax=Natronobacterium haloterrestre TaxID=148448 RepID=A0A1I1JUW6_NATHA|nr:hypothetical protein SAMN05444422_109190 [Halobiforma haloterrestris]